MRALRAGDAPDDVVESVAIQWLHDWIFLGPLMVAVGLAQRIGQQTSDDRAPADAREWTGRMLMALAIFSALLQEVLRPPSFH